MQAEAGHVFPGDARDAHYVAGIVTGHKSLVCPLHTMTKQLMTDSPGATTLNKCNASGVGIHMRLLATTLMWAAGQHHLLLIVVRLQRSFCKHRYSLGLDSIRVRVNSLIACYPLQDKECGT